MKYGFGYKYAPFTKVSTLSFTPLSLPNIELWLDASDESTITKDGSDNVSGWTDKSPNAYEAEQLTGTAQFKWMSSGFGSNSTAYMDCLTGNRWMELGNELSHLSEWTFFIVMNTVNSTGNHVLMGSTNAGALVDSEYHLRMLSGKYEVVVSDDANYSRALTSIAYAIDEVVVTTQHKNGEATPLIREQGVALSTAHSGSGTSNTGTVRDNHIANATGTAFYFDGYVAEIIMYNRELPTSEIEEVEEYLNSKHGVY